MISTFARKIRALDVFGHAIKVNYKGQEAYNSVLGGIFTLIMYVLTIVLVIRSVEEIVLMRDPVLREYSKLLNPEDRAELIPVRLEAYDFVFGLTT